MFIIYWDYLNRNNICFQNNKMEFSTREAANDFWKTLKDMDGITNIRTETDQPKKKYIALQCVFSGGSRQYTYLSKSKVDVGSFVVVYTNDGRELVRVVSCAEKTEAELTETLPMSKYKYIQGKVVAV